jgi:hypothetical protein
MRLADGQHRGKPAHLQRRGGFEGASSGYGGSKPVGG